MSYNNENLNDMIKCLEKHKYDYTEYKHKNGYCSIKTDVLLKQLMLNETEIRNKAIDELTNGLIDYFAENASKVYNHISARDFICDNIEVIAEQLKAGDKRE